MPLESYPLKLETAVIERIKTEAEQLGIPHSRHGRQLIHSALEHDEGEEFDRVKQKLFALEAKIDRLTDTFIDGLTAILRTLAVDEKGNQPTFTEDEANAFIERLTDPES